MTKKLKPATSPPVIKKLKPEPGPPVQAPPFDFEAFHGRMFNLMVNEIANAIPIDQLVSMHNGLVDKYYETEGSDHEPPVTFALSVCDAAIMKKQGARFLN